MIEINGKEYPLWSQFVERKEKWIGGTLQDFGDSIDRTFGFSSASTKITDITLKPNGTDSAFFCIEGKDFGSGFDTQYGGISGFQEPGWLAFSGYGSQKFRIKEKE